MDRPQSSAIPTKPGRRHPLLYQRRLNEQVFWTSVAIMAACAALLIWNPEPFEPFRPLLALILLGAGLILILTSLFRLRAYAQCRSEVLCIQLPFYRLDVAYRDIRVTRPTQLQHLFAPERQSWTQRSFLGPLWNSTVIVVEVDKLPHSQRGFRLWMSKYMLCPDVEGLVLPVADWIAFRSELDEAIARARRSF